MTPHPVHNPADRECTCGCDTCASNDKCPTARPAVSLSPRNVLSKVLPSMHHRDHFSFKIAPPSASTIKRLTAYALVTVALYLAGTVVHNNLPKSGVCPTTVIPSPRTDLNLNFITTALPVTLFWTSLAALSTILAYWRMRKSSDKAVFFMLGAAAAGWATFLSHASSLVAVGHGHLVHFNLGILLTVFALLGLINLTRDLVYKNVPEK